MSVRIVVDSSSDITELEAKEMGLTMLPIPINFGEEDYLDGVDIKEYNISDLRKNIAICK